VVTTYFLKSWNTREYAPLCHQGQACLTIAAFYIECGQIVRFAADIAVGHLWYEN